MHEKNNQAQVCIKAWEETEAKLANSKLNERQSEYALETLYSLHLIHIHITQVTIMHAHIHMKGDNTSSHHGIWPA